MAMDLLMTGGVGTLKTIIIMLLEELMVQRLLELLVQKQITQLELQALVGDMAIRVLD